MKESRQIRARMAFGAVGVIMLILASLVLVTVTAAAQGARLTKGRVAPASGTTATVFTFFVDFQGSGETAIAVTAVVAGRVVPLTGFSGTAMRGSWRGSSKLPAGTWQVTFRAISSGATNPTLPGPAVVVRGSTSPPTPTPTPTPRPTARPTPTPSVVPTRTPLIASLVPGTTSTPEPTVASFGTIIEDASDPGSSSSSGGQSASPAGSSSSKGPIRVPTEGFVAIGLLATVAVAAASAERRRRRAPPAASAVPAEAEESPLDEDTIGTIEYVAPSEHAEGHVDELPADEHPPTR